jgi:hypothetical protein
MIILAYLLAVAGGFLTLLIVTNLPAIPKGLYKCDSCGFIQRDCKKHSSIDLCPCGADDWSQNYGNNNERDQPMKEVS